jgi:hypothetical protein
MSDVPLQNRVTPHGEVIATPHRGAWMGNRGVLHDEARRIVRPFVPERRWICCRTEFRGRRRTPMSPGRYTELFFLDEATALAAGHRPCHECRRADARRFRDAWARGNGVEPGIRLGDLDRLLDADRREARDVMRRWVSPVADLPDGAMVDVDGAAHLVACGALRPWSPGGYGPARRAPAETLVLTPRSIVAAIAAGYAPQTAS